MIKDDSKPILVTSELDGVPSLYNTPKCLKYIEASVATFVVMA